MRNIKQKNNFPAYVSAWTDKYFHQSAYDNLFSFPSKRIINYLSKFKKSERVTLYRGINKYNSDNYTGVESWTYEKDAAERYIDKIGGKILKKVFSPKNILLDTTLLSGDDKKFLGYDYSLDDKEVLIIA